MPFSIRGIIVSDVMEETAFVSCSTQTGRKYLSEIAVRSCNPQYGDAAYIGDETPKVARAHATSIAFVR